MAPGANRYSRPSPAPPGPPQRNTSPAAPAPVIHAPELTRQPPHHEQAQATRESDWDRSRAAARPTIRQPPAAFHLIPDPSQQPSGASSSRPKGQRPISLVARMAAARTSGLPVRV